MADQPGSPSESPESLVRIVYYSVLTLSGDISPPQLVEEIRECAAAANKEASISGVILFNESTLEIIQVLEGSEARVDALFHKISADPRHHDVKVHVRKTTTTRQYAEWGMLRGEAGVHWKAVRMLLPAGIPGKTMATFDEAFDALNKAPDNARAASTPEKKTKAGLFSCFRSHAVHNLEK